MSKSIVKNTGYLYAKVLVNILISLFTTRLLLQALGHSDFGLWGIIGGVIAFLSFLNPALSEATQRFMSFYEGKGNVIQCQKVFSLSVCLHFAIAVIIVIFLELMSVPLFSYILNIEEASRGPAFFIYQCMIVSLFFTVISVPYDATINANEDMKYYAFVGIIDSFLKLLSAVAINLDVVLNKLEVYGICNVGITLFIMVLMRVYCKSNYSNVNFSLKLIDRSLLREMSRFASWNLLWSFSSIIGNYGVGIVNNHFFGTVVNAAGSITGQLGGYLQTFSTNMMKAVNPVIVKSAGKGDLNRSIEYSMRSCKFSFLLFALFCIPVFVQTETILLLWLGTIPLWTVIFIKIHFVRVLFEQIVNPLRSAINASGNNSKMNFYSSISQIICIPIILIFLINGADAYWSLVIASIFMAIIPGVILVFCAKKYCNLNVRTYLGEIVFKNLVCFFLSLIVCLLLKDLFSLDGIKGLVVTLMLHLMCFIPSIYLISFSRNEKAYLIGLKSKIKFKR